MKSRPPRRSSREGARRPRITIPRRRRKRCTILHRVVKIESLPRATSREAAAASDEPRTGGQRPEGPRPSPWPRPRADRRASSRDLRKGAVEPVVVGPRDGAGALWAHHIEEDKLEIETIKGQLEAAKWPEFGS